MPSLSPMLRRAVQAARSGDRVLALDLFLEVVEQDPYSARAWIELSTLVEDPEDQATALENALALRPGDTALQAKLISLRDNHPQLRLAPLSHAELQANERLYELGLEHIRAGRTALAVKCFEDVTATNPRDSRAWLMLSELLHDPQAKVRALEKVVAAQPLHEEAWRRLENLRQVQHRPLRQGETMEARGDFERAAQIYLAIVTHSSSAVERREALLRLEKLQLGQEARELQPVNASLNLARITLGPALLFAVMVFIQSGLNPLHLPLLAIPGLMSVLAGSLIVSVTGMRPAHPLWVRLFGIPGTGDEPEMNRSLRLLGLALLLAPYTMFLIEAGRRLGVLQASMLGY